MAARESAIVSSLQTRLDLHYSSWQVTDLRLEASGMEFVVCRDDSPKHGPLAFRVPWERHFANDNDESVDARELLRQEAALACHANSFGIATPLVRHLHIGKDGFDFLVSEFVVHDRSAPDPREFGQLTRAIHDCPVPDIKMVMQGEREVDDIIAERLLYRLDTAVMLAVVFLSEAPNARRAKSQIGRVVSLFEAFRRTIP